MKTVQQGRTGLIAGTMALGALVCLAAAPQVRLAAQDLPSAAAVASPRTYVSLLPVPRNHEFEIAVVVRIMPGFHMNANKVSLDYLIPTTLTATLPAGFKEIATSYPEGKTLKLSFSDTPLSVYTGSFTVRMKLSAGADTALGKQTLPFVLKYQACNDTSCLPPVKVPVTAAIEVAPARAKARAMSPEIFSAQPVHIR
ncbi:MAG TPA: protein-disulfide reductase DsbD domain-containing protein [Candidatus Acidoferrales bacterium]|nr:protein-disulfide reductase DsbD domain-containing protein [Candidatus Acidoferrales bacterium]